MKNQDEVLLPRITANHILSCLNRLFPIGIFKRLKFINLILVDSLRRDFEVEHPRRKRLNAVDGIFSKRGPGAKTGRGLD